MSALSPGRPAPRAALVGAALAGLLLGAAVVLSGAPDADAAPGPAGSAGRGNAGSAGRGNAGSGATGREPAVSGASGSGQTGGAPAPADSAGAGSGAGGSAPDGGLPTNVYSSCVEFLPEGATRPKMTESFPLRGLAGHALPLELVVEHGAGETVLPQGFALQSRGVEADALTKSRFMIPSPDGGAPPQLSPMSTATGAKTRVVLNLVALPIEAGRHEMTIPPLPIAISRASGEMMTLCTQPHTITVDDPTSSTPDARPRPNPPPRRQLEDWAAARTAMEFLGVALVAALVGALTYRWWRRRPRPVPPPPPPRPAWDVALEALYTLREGPLLREERYPEYVDAVNDVVRRYLGSRYGFDGLEATSREVRRAVRAIVPPLPVLMEIDQILDESDLIKFARVTPSMDDCGILFGLGETIVKQTIPLVTVSEQMANPSPEGGAAAPAGEGAAPTARELGGVIPEAPGGAWAHPGPAGQAKAAHDEAVAHEAAAVAAGEASIALEAAALAEAREAAALAAAFEAAARARNEEETIDAPASIREDALAAEARKAREAAEKKAREEAAGEAAKASGDAKAGPQGGEGSS